MERNILHILTICLLIIAPAIADASPMDSAKAVHQSEWKPFARGVEQNPAMFGNTYLTSYSQLMVTYDYQHQSEAFVPQLGNGHSIGSAEVNTFLRMGQNTSAWGSASYANGTNRNITWNSTSDYQLLAPYVLADTLGGDTKYEHYGFSGGYATTIGHYDVGCEAKFRTEHEYRDVDPRMRGIVTDLTLKAGGAAHYLGWKFGLALEANVYKQTNDVDFYYDLGVIPEYQMTGLGTEYSRFSGDKRTLYYKGGGTAIRLHAEPANLTHSQGFYADLLLRKQNYKRVIADLNSMPLTNLTYNTIEAYLGWKHNGVTDFELCTHLLYTEKSGDEYIAGKSASQYYPIIGSLTMYKNYLGNASVEASYGKRKSDGSWHIGAEGGVRSNREHYVYPQRKLDAMHVFGLVKAEIMRQVSQLLQLHINLSARYDKCVDDDIVMPYATMSEAVKSLVAYEYRFRKADYVGVCGTVRADYRLPESQQGLFAELGGAFQSADSETDVRAHLSVGITF